MSIQTEDGSMGPQEEGLIHTATPLGITGLGVPRTSEEALLAVDQPQTSDLRELLMRVEEVTPQIGITRIREELSPATPTERM